jgi:hypothetical protein
MKRKQRWHLVSLCGNEVYPFRVSFVANFVQNDYFWRHFDFREQVHPNFSLTLSANGNGA